MYYINPKEVVKNHASGHEIPQWDIVVMCFHSIEKTNKLVQYLGAKKVGYRLFSKCDVDMVYEVKIKEHKIGVLGWCTGGGPLVASLIEEVTVTGVKWLIGIGAAASIVDEIKRNQIILPTEVLVNDGVSKCYYKRERLSIDNDIHILIKNILLQNQYDYVEVRGATVEALYRQNEKMLEPWREQGVQVVNWELSPFYVVSKKNRIKSAWLGHVSDVEFGGIWKNWYSERNMSFERVMEICKLIILTIIEVKTNENKFKDYNEMSS